MNAFTSLLSSVCLNGTRVIMRRSEIMGSVLVASVAAQRERYLRSFVVLCTGLELFSTIGRRHMHTDQAPDYRESGKLLIQFDASLACNSQ